MSDTPLCRECGVELVANAPGGLCLDCWKGVAIALAARQLRAEFVAAGKGELFDVIKVFLTGKRVKDAWAHLAAELKLTEAALKMAISRMRRRYAALIRQELAGIPGNPFAITDDQDKWRALLKTVASLPTNRGTFLIAPLSAVIGEVKDRPNPEDYYSDAWTVHCPHCGCEITAGRKHCFDCEIIVLTEPGNSQVFEEDSADTPVGAAEKRRENPADTPVASEKRRDDSTDKPICASEESRMVRGTLWTVGGILVAMLSYPVLAAGSLGGTNIVAWGVIFFGAVLSLQALRGEGVFPGIELIAYEELAAAKRLESMGHDQEALAAYELVVEKYPDTEAGRTALQSIARLQT